MGLDETAQLTVVKLQHIASEATSLANLITSALVTIDCGEDGIAKLSAEDKQKVIQHFQTRKARLAKLFSELP